MTSKIKVTLLGTSGQIPSANRNHTAILLTYEGENILVDCGEGTQRQFRKSRLNPCKLTKILITHWHGDHVFGIPGVLSTLALQGYNKTLQIYGPKGTKEFMDGLLKIFRFERSYKIEVHEVSGKFYEAKDFYLEAEKMEHGIPCNAYSFVKKGLIRIDKNKLKKYKIPEGKHLKNLKEGKDILYEGKKFKAKDLTYGDEDKKISFVLDTKENSRIVPFVQNSDLLIMESSFSEEIKDHAEEHLHLTFKQAGEIAKKSNSKKLVLTHISQRYEKDIDKVLKEAKNVFKNSIVAKDFDSFEV